MNGKLAYTLVPPSPRVRAVEDEWGLFDSNKAGLKAAFRAVLETTAPDGTGLEPADRDGVLEMIFPDDLPAPDIRSHQTAARDLDSAQRGPGPARHDSQAASSDEAVYDLTEVEESVPRHKHAERGAVYTLEFPTRCPQCCSAINAVRVSRLLRTEVSFTSTLPRKGYIIVCPECDGILSAELSGLI